MPTEHRIQGRPDSLGEYLKCIGLLRVVAEQADSLATGRWDALGFFLGTSIGADALASFIRESYAPTPVVGPWGGRSGFFPHEVTASKSIGAIEQSSCGRLEPYREAIASARGILAGLGIEDKADVAARRQEVMTAMVSGLPDAALEYVAACYSTREDGTDFGWLLGTGGNEGNGSYHGWFAESVVGCIVERQCDHAVAPALFGGAARGAAIEMSAGQYFAGAPVNPWEYLMCIEGAIVFRPLGPGGPYPGICLMQPGAGVLANDGWTPEFWAPMWQRSLTYPELRLRMAPNCDGWAGSYHRWIFPTRNGPRRIACTLGVHRAGVPGCGPDTGDMGRRRAREAVPNAD